MNFKKIIFFLALLSIIAIGMFLLNKAPSGMRDDAFLVEKGDSLRHIAGKLMDKNLIKNDKFFVYLAIIEGRSNIMTGKYKIYKGMSSRDIIKKMSAGDIIRRKVTIPEGFNLYEVAEKLDENKITDADSFLEHAFDQVFLQSIGIKHESAEGLLFPDTYIFNESEDARDIIVIMHKNFKNVLNQFNFSDKKIAGLNIYAIINIASLIEKEARVHKERKYISAVFHKRLNLGMRLDCDPSVKYGLKKFKDRLTYKDLKYDTQYNTYLHTGLPPTPICSPGKESITAAINPAKSNYLYFVARNDGSHYFSKTLKEHSRAVDYYQKGIRNGFNDRQNLQP
ncbi:MAG: endolytic transglycosylase MltG [Spirochaetota bacterium]